MQINYCITKKKKSYKGLYIVENLYFCMFSILFDIIKDFPYFFFQDFVLLRLISKAEECDVYS